MTKAKRFWAVEVTDPHPTLGGKTVKAPFVCREHAELWAKEEVWAARDLGITGVTTRVYAVSA